ncbi:MAG: folate-binding protein [Betaproteobacteria bacterium]|nr:folate-binding protein [Betaproteobacteria bacterium]
MTLPHSDAPSPAPAAAPAAAPQGATLAPSSGPAAPALSPAGPPPPAFGFEREPLQALADDLGVALLDDPAGPLAGHPMPALAPWPSGLVMPVFDLGLLRASGPEAVRFLHSQLTNDIEKLAPGTAQWSGYCTAKGRLQASFLGWRADTPEAPVVELALTLPLAPVLRKRLSMFVLRAKLKITDDSARAAFFGLAGESAGRWLAGHLGTTPAEGEVVHAAGLTAIGLPAVALDACGLNLVLPRWLLSCPRDQAAGLWTAARAALPGGPGALWRWLEVLSGLPRVTPGTWEHFVPQMVNLELVGGVNFKKGCYPGQEVVARSQYLGKLKRRMHLGRVDGLPPAPGADVSAAGGHEPCGEVVLAAADPLRGGALLLFESQTAAVQAGALSVDGRAISLLPLPYSLPA